ncbi:MAG: 50S ribosomal protein L4 [Thermoanaerobaculia bacterium]|jgi:large subunit ribosomal protein L4
MKVVVKNLDNKKVREIELPDEVFGYPYKEHLIHSAVLSYLAARRSGTHKTKTRREVAGSGRKLWRQKGTGRARIGGIRSPLWRGGGTVHGPQPRSHADKLSPREKRNALKSALSRKLKDAEILIVDRLEVDTHKTKDLAGKLQGLGVSGRALLVDTHGNENLALAARNNPRVKTVDALAVNVYDVVDRAHIVVSEEALNRMVEVLSK